MGLGNFQSKLALSALGLAAFALPRLAMGGWATKCIDVPNGSCCPAPIGDTGITCNVPNVKIKSVGACTNPSDTDKSHQYVLITCSPAPGTGTSQNSLNLQTNKTLSELVVDGKKVDMGPLTPVEPATANTTSTDLKPAAQLPKPSDLQPGLQFNAQNDADTQHQDSADAPTAASAAAGTTDVKGPSSPPNQDAKASPAGGQTAPPATSFATKETTAAIDAGNAKAAAPDVSELVKTAEKRDASLQPVDSPAAQSPAGASAASSPQNVGFVDGMGPPSQADLGAKPGLGQTSGTAPSGDGSGSGAATAGTNDQSPGGTQANTTSPSGSGASHSQMSDDRSKSVDRVEADTDECTKSGDFDARYMEHCKHTGTFVKATAAATMAAQGGGSMVLQAMGQNQQQKLAQSGASQVDVYKASAEMQMKAAMLQTAIGAAQIAAGYMEGRAADEHAKAAKQLRDVSVGRGMVGCTPDPANPAKCAIGAEFSAATGAPSLAKAVLDKKSGAVYNSLQGSETAITADRRLASYGEAGYKEQLAWKGNAQGASQKDYIQGGSTALSGLMAMAAAQQAEKIAKTLANAPAGIKPPGADPFNPTAVSTGPTPIVATGTDATPQPLASAAANVAVPGAPGGGLPGDLGGGGLANPGPAPGAFVPGAGGTSGGNTGGGGGLGGSTATTSSPPGSAEDPQARYADNSRGGGASYQGSGGVGGGSGAKAGGSADPTLALKDALAAMMGQQDKKDDPGVDITNFRKVASDDPTLPKNENFFTYIHTAYEGLQKKGRVGL